MLMVTMTFPGFGEMEPDIVTEEPRETELEEVKEMLVDGRVKVVRVVEVVVLVDVWVHAVMVVVVTVVDVLVKLVVVWNVDVVAVVVVVDVVVRDVTVACTMMLVVCVVLVTVHA